MSIYAGHFKCKPENRDKEVENLFKSYHPAGYNTTIVDEYLDAKDGLWHVLYTRYTSAD